MGLFSSKKIVTVGVIRSGLVDNPPDTIRDATLKSVMTNGSIVDNIQIALLNGFNSKADKYLNYGRTTFTNRLPEGDRGYTSVRISDVAVVVESFVGEPVTVRTAMLDIAQDDFFAFEYVQKVYGWNAATNIVTNPPAGTIGNAQIHTITAIGSQLEIQFRHNPVKSWIYVQDTENFYSIMRRVEITTFSYFYLRMVKPPAVIMHHVTYTIDSDVSQQLKYWNYDSRTNKYPSLALDASTKITSLFYPIVPIRTNKANLINYPTSSLYKTSNKMLGYIGLDLKTITAGVTKSSNISDIDDVMFMFSLGIRDQNKYSIDYLFSYWKKEAQLRSSGFILGDIFDTTPISNSINVSDAQFRVTIDFTGITHQTKKGIIGKKGFVKSVTTILPRGVIEGDSTPTNPWGNLQRTYFERSYITYYKQVTDTTYEFVRVIGLTHTSYINGRKHAVVLDDAAGFFIPLNYDILKSFNGVDESYILYNAMSVIVYWQNVQKVKWYQRTFFKILLVIVIVVVAITTGYIDLNSLAALSVGDLAIAALETFVIGMALDKLAELGGIFAVIAAVYAMYKFQLGSFAAGADGVTMTWAESLMKAVTMISDEFMHLIEIDAVELMKDSAEFLKSTEERDKELEDASDLLDNEYNNIYDPLFIMNQRSFFNPGESPTAYFNRSLNTNPGVASLDYTQSYASISLSLPTWNGLSQAKPSNYSTL